MNKNLRPYLSLALLTGLNLFNYMDRYVLAAVVPPLKAELLLSDAEIGWLTSAFMIGYFTTAPAFGYLGDRWPRKGLMVFGVAFWSLGTILSGFCNDFWTLLACRVLVGLGEASFAVLAPAWLADLFPAARRNNAMTIFYVAIPVGSALGYIVGGAALAYGGWRTGFWWAGGPGLLLALTLLMLTEPERGESGNGASSGMRAGFSEFTSLFRIGDFVLVVLGLTAYTFAIGAFGAWGPTFLNRVHGLELGFADHFFGGVLVVGGLLGTLIGGFAATAWRRKARAGYALLLTLAAFLTLVSATLAFLNIGLTASMVFLGAAIFSVVLAHRTAGDASDRERTRTLAGERNGRLDLRHSPVWRFPEPGIGWASGGLGARSEQAGRGAATRHVHSARGHEPGGAVLGLARVAAGRAGRAADG